MPQFLPEYSPKKLAELGMIVEKKNKTQLYESLRHSLRKIQWVKLIGLKAIHIEEELTKAIIPNSFVLDPLRQTAHSLCVTDCLIHTKSALDSIAVFLNDFLKLGWKGGQRDFKLKPFRESVYKKDLFFKSQIKKLEPWFTNLQNIRDEWIHIKAVKSLSVHGKSEVGMLPIPKRIFSSVEEQKNMPVDSRNFWSTKNFVQYYYSKLAGLFRIIIDRSLQIEKLDPTEPVSIHEQYMDMLALFPTHSTEKMQLEKIRIRIPNSMADW